MTEMKPLDITPETKVGALLDAYPEIEERLIALAPPFAKLRNPVLRRTVAKVTTLRQAAKVGNVSLGTLINALREAAGLGAASFDGSPGPSAASGAPEWFDESRISDRLDARPMIESGAHPLGVVMERLSRLEPGQIFQLVTPFVPAPLIELAAQKSYQAWNRQTEPDRFETFFARVGKT